MKGLTNCLRCGGTGQVPDPVYRGNEARQRRLKADISLREMARRLHLSAAYLSDLELGRRGWNERLMKRYDKSLRG